MKYLRYYRTPLRVFGAPVFLHWSFIVAALLILFLSNDTARVTLMFVVSYTLVIFTHEIGHAFIANRLGAEVYSIKIGALHGLCTYEDAGDIWDNTLISWGGVLAQLAIALPLTFISWLVGLVNLGVFQICVVVAGYFSIAWVVINMAPVAPLDGYLMWRIVPLYISKKKAKDRVKKHLKSL